MLGCCGVVTNLPPLPRGYVRVFHFFHRGIFHDARVGVHGAAPDTLPPLIRSTYLSGGLSAYRREVFEAVPFDIANEFFLLEDIDFSTRAAARFGERFYINCRARLEHRMLSPLDRTVLGLRQRRKLREFLVFYKKRRGQKHAGAALLLLLAGLLLESGYDALRAAHYSPFLGYFLGLRDGMRWQLAEPP
jgi:GT2 family glycosyltransferase